MHGAIIFDVDGTLSETEETHRRAFNRAFEAAGLAWHWDSELYDRLLAVTGGKERIRYYIESFGGRARRQTGSTRTFAPCMPARPGPTRAWWRAARSSCGPVSTP